LVVEKYEENTRKMMACDFRKMAKGEREGDDGDNCWREKFGIKNDFVLV
jgi:hypothetical protein